MLGLSQTAFNSIGLFSSLRESANLFRAASKGWSGLSSYLFSCFAAGTPLLTPEGSRLIEQFEVGDLVLSRSESVPDGPLEAKVVEEVFVRTGRILNLHVGGQMIRTTPEHPFFVQEKGWLPGGKLRTGHLLASHDGR